MYKCAHTHTHTQIDEVDEVDEVDDEVKNADAMLSVVLARTPCTLCTRTQTREREKA